ncbi:sugar phosphate isomerase/epimerase family protein [Aurantiacibacter flavus]|uniref:Sugar phosphate isomerase/epimerase n=1 Tax=Aurantiacibacter flavus TaxID=3145232 RepID=A0ABV0CSL7_9SPHN
MDRRTLLGTMGAVGASAFLSGCAGATEPVATPFFKRIGKPIGLQTYALGPEAGEDLGETFAILKELGFGEVELPNLYDRSATEVRALADAAGMPIASLHVHAVPLTPGATFVLGDDPTPVIDAAEELGVREIVIPVPVVPEGFAMREGEGFGEAMNRAFSSVGVEHWQAMAEMLNLQGAAVKERGLVLGYHNHNLEFAPVGESTGWDVLMSETDADLVKVQLDVGWVTQAGLDPLEELNKLRDRVISLHVKDVAEGFTPSYYLAPNPIEVGQGIIDWASVLLAAEAAGVGHYFVEQEPPFTKPRLEAMRQSLQFLQSLAA